MKKLIKFLIFLTVACILLILYARFIGTRGLRVEEVSIDSNITEDFYGFKIVQISDLNYGEKSKKEDLDKLVEKINTIKPNVIVITGNLLNTDNSDLIDELTSGLRDLEAVNGKYAITGSNDLNYDYNGLLNSIGFSNIDNDFKKIYNSTNNYILISGVSTMEDNTEFKTKKTEDFLLENTPVYSILLTHEPDTVKLVNVDNYDLILAGHTLGGLVRVPFYGGLFKQGNDSIYFDSYYKINTTDLYISSGVGCTKYNYRLFNKPVINLFRLT